MQQVLIWQCATWIAPMLRAFVRSLPSAGSLVCSRCGLSITARGADGTSAYTFEIASPAANSLPFKHVAVVTFDGKLLISCASSASDAPVSDPPSGNVAGISFSLENSARDARDKKLHWYWNARGILGESGQGCGCDPMTDYLCERHETDFLNWSPT